MLTDLIEMHFIDIVKFRKLKEKNLKEDKLQRWLTFFKDDISQEELEELIEMDEDIKKVEEKIEYLSSDPKTMELYKARERSLHDRANMISGAIEDGMEMGISKGIEIGAKGAKEEDAMNFLGFGVDEEIVAKSTGLSIEKIRELKSKIRH